MSFPRTHKLVRSEGRWDILVGTSTEVLGNAEKGPPESKRPSYSSASGQTEH